MIYPSASHQVNEGEEGGRSSGVGQRVQSSEKSQTMQKVSLSGDSGHAVAESLQH